MSRNMHCKEYLIDLVTHLKQFPMLDTLEEKNSSSYLSQQEAFIHTGLMYINGERFCETLDMVIYLYAEVVLSQFESFPEGYQGKKDLYTFKIDVIHQVWDKGQLKYQVSDFYTVSDTSNFFITGKSIILDKIKDSVNKVLGGEPLREKLSTYLKVSYGR